MQIGKIEIKDGDIIVIKPASLMAGSSKNDIKSWFLKAIGDSLKNVEVVVLDVGMDLMVLSRTDK